jgi:GMP synthase-like glutamine amidotransferase
MNTNKSIIFLSGNNDSIVDKAHSETLYRKFNGHKELLIFEGTHNSQRSDYVLRQCFKFIEESLKPQASLK